VTIAAHTRPAYLAGRLLWMPTIFWETCLSTLLLLGMVALSLHAVERPRTILWPAMGAYCGLAALVNPALLLTLLVCVLVYAPWPIRNARLR